MTEIHDQVAHLLKQVEQEAYARGWTDAIAALQAKAASLAESAPGMGIIQDRPLPKPDVVADDAPRGRGRPAKAISIVEDIILTGPGMKGVEIVSETERRGTPVLERTVRSCLARLRERRVIWQRKGRWYPRDRAAADHSNPDQLNGETLFTSPH
jgi:hypothetical protein